MRTLSLFFVAILSVSVYSQEFTLSSEYDKQLKKYPFITPFYADSCADLEFMKDLVYGVVGHRKLTLDVFLKKDSHDSRVVVLIHGGGWRSGDKSMDHQIAKMLANAGSVCVCVDYRKSAEALYPAAVDDIRRSLCWIVDNCNSYFSIDKDSLDLVLLGTSAGGQLAALIGTNSEEEQCYHVDKVIDVDGVLAFLHKDSEEGKDRPGKLSSATMWFGVSVAEDSSKWIDASALSHVNENSADYLFVNSSQKRFSAGQSDMIDSLRMYGHKTEVYKVEDTPHTFWLFNPWANSVIDYIINWLR